MALLEVRSRALRQTVDRSDRGVVGSFVILGGFGFELYRKAPPIPNRVVTTAGQVLFTGEEIRDGQNVWQSMGGQEVGTVWGHGAYVAPDWSADWLHRECVSFSIAGRASARASLRSTRRRRQAGLRERLKKELRTNTYDPRRAN